MRRERERGSLQKWLTQNALEIMCPIFIGLFAQPQIQSDNGITVFSDCNNSNLSPFLIGRCRNLLITSDLFEKLL